MIAIGVEAKNALRGLKDLRDGLLGFYSTVKQGLPSVSDLRNQVDDLRSSMIDLMNAAGMGRLKDFVEDATLLAGRVENLKTVLNAVGKNANYSSGELSVYTDQVKALGITTQAARESLTRMAQVNLDLDHAAKLARISQDAAVISGKNSSEAFQHIATAISRANAWMLRSQGIMVSARAEFIKYAKEIGKTVPELTSMDKVQAILNATLERGAAIAGTYEAAMKDAYKQFTSMDRYREEATRLFGQQFLPLFARVVQAQTSILKFWIEAPNWVKETTASFATFMVTGIAFLTLIRGWTVALTAFKAAWTTLLSTRPELLALAAAAAALAAAYVYVSAQAANAREAHETKVVQIRREVTETARLKQVVEIISTLGRVNGKTALQQREFNSAMNEAIIMLPEYADRLRALRDKPGAFINQVIQANKNITLDEGSQIAKLISARERAVTNATKFLRGFSETENRELVNKLAEQKRTITWWEANVARSNTGSRQGEGGFAEGNLSLSSDKDAPSGGRVVSRVGINDELLKIQRIDEEIKALQSASGDRTFKWLETLRKQLDETDASAQKTLKKTLEVRGKFYEDDALSMADNYANTVKLLNARVLREQEVDQYIAQLHRRRLEAIQEQFDKDTAGVKEGTRAYQEALGRKAASTAELNVEMASKASELREQIADVQKAQASAIEAMKLQAEALHAKNVSVYRESVAVWMGADKQIAKSFSEREELLTKNARIEQEWGVKITEQRQRVAITLREFQQSPVSTKAESHARLQKEQSTLDQMLQMYRLSADNRRQVEFRLENDLYNLRKDTIKKLVEQNDHLTENHQQQAQRIAEIHREMSQRILTAQADIGRWAEDRKARREGVKNPGLQDAQQEFRAIEDQIGKAQNLQQANQVWAEWKAGKQDIQKKFGGLVGKRAGANAQALDARLQQFDKKIQQAWDKRKVQLAEQAQKDAETIAREQRKLELIEKQIQATDKQIQANERLMALLGLQVPNVQGQQNPQNQIPNVQAQPQPNQQNQRQDPKARLFNAWNMGNGQNIWNVQNQGQQNQGQQQNPQAQQAQQNQFAGQGVDPRIFQDLANAQKAANNALANAMKVVHANIVQLTTGFGEIKGIAIQITDSVNALNTDLATARKQLAEALKKRGIR